MKKVTSIKDITMVEMKHDEVLSKWSFVKCSSQGVVTAPMPYSMYNRLLDKIGKDVCGRHNLVPEPTAKTASSGQYSSEEEFEDEVMEPLLRHSVLNFLVSISMLLYNWPPISYHVLWTSLFMMKKEL